MAFPACLSNRVCVQFPSSSGLYAEREICPSFSFPIARIVSGVSLRLLPEPIDDRLVNLPYSGMREVNCLLLSSPWRRMFLKANFNSATRLFPFDLNKRKSQSNKRRNILVGVSNSSYGGRLPEESLIFAGMVFSSREVQIAGAAAVAIMLGVTNRVLYKMALVPLRNYPFFLAQLTTFGYVLVYFSILYVRYQAGIVTDEMLELPKIPFLAVGFLEAIAIASGMAAAAILSGASIPILSQTFLVWQLILSTAFLGKRYTFSQIMGCAMVIAGVAITLISGGGASEQSLWQGLFWPLVMISSSAFQAGASILKEFIFQAAAQQLKGGSVDLFVVNSFGSGFQAGFVLLMLPFLAKLQGIPFSQLPSYFKAGAACFFNIGSQGTECNGAPLLPLLYVAVNISFNVSVLRLLKMSSAVVSSLCMTIAVPLSIYMFTLRLPYIGAPASLLSEFYFGAAVLVAGLAIYNFSDRTKKVAKND